MIRSVAASAVLMVLPAVCAGSVTEGGRLPSFTVSRVGGGTLSPEVLKGRVGVLCFWGTWARPSRALLPHLAGLQKTLGAQRVTVIAVAMDDKPDEAARFASQNGLKLPIGIADRALARQIAQEYLIGAVPMLYIVDPDGIVQYIQKGYLPGSERSIGMALRRTLAASRTKR
jgi:thiol-disulfide isomerase/thioredoxin